MQTQAVQAIGQTLAAMQHQQHQPPLSHPVLEGKPNANHVRARIRNSRTQRLHKCLEL
jgi:hypothetical protein